MNGRGLRLNGFGAANLPETLYIPNPKPSSGVPAHIPKPSTLFNPKTLKKPLKKPV